MKLKMIPCKVCGQKPVIAGGRGICYHCWEQAKLRQKEEDRL